MRGRTLSADETDSFCTNCGFVAAIRGDSVNRCTECGQFVSPSPDVCCAHHEVQQSPYPSGTCPYCEQERDRQAQLRHEMTRDSRVEPY